MFEALSWEAWVTLAVVAAVFVALVREVARPEVILLSSLAPLLVFGILTPDQAFAGLANSAVLAVGSLFVVAAGVQRTGALTFTDRLLFARSSRPGASVPRLMLTTASMSAFLNNTPIVAMLIPRVQAWCEQTGIPASKVMIPLSYASIVGGMTTLIGTSTNLLVAGLMEAEGYEGLGLFDLSWVGVPAALAVIAYFSVLGHRWLPDRSEEATEFQEGLTECLFEVRVAPDSPLVGQSVEEAGLRALGNAYLVHVRHGGEIIPSSPEAVLRSGDVLMFRGSASMMESLLARPGLQRVVESVETSAVTTLPLYEAVVAPTSELVGHSLKEVGFRERYQGVVLGIRRRDVPVDGSLSNVAIQPGDLLLVEAQNGFDKRWNQNRDEFYLVAPRRLEKPKVQRGKAPLALGILFGVIALAAIGVTSIVTAAFVGALAMIGTGCLRVQEARHAVDISVLLVIAAALGIGEAISATGLAATVAGGMVSAAAGLGVIGVIAAVYIATSIMTELITNNAAAALMLGVGLAAAEGLGAPPEAFAVAVAIAASASFVTPIGYQTNLMVMAAGGYKFADYTRSGLAVNLIVTTVALTMIWLVWL
jgi:di/tricarboxylate transporter